MEAENKTLRMGMMMVSTAFMMGFAYFFANGFPEGFSYFFMTKPEPAAAKADETPFLNKKRQTVPIIEKEDISHDTQRIRFGLPSPDMRLGLPVGKHFKVFCPNPKSVVEGEHNGRPDGEAGKTEIERKYTPTTNDNVRGFVDLVIKVYRPGTVKMPDGKEMKWSDGGKMSQFLGNAKVGDNVDVSGPWGMNEYKGCGSLKAGSKNFTGLTHIGMMAGGTGITPMLQVLNAILNDPADNTKCSLIYANKTESDILVKDLLDDLAAKFPDQFKLWYTLDFPPAGWKYGTGFITQEMIQENLCPPSDSTVVLMCGPPPMVKYACRANLDKLNYAANTQIDF